MFKSYLQIILAMLFLTGFQFNSAWAIDKIKIHLQQPPHNKLGVSDLWKLDLENTTNENLTIYLEGFVTEGKDGLIVEGLSKAFVIKPGKSTYGYNDFKNGSVNWKNKKYQEAIVRTGNAPTGIYTICVTAKLENGEIAGQENCIEQNIEITNVQQIMLVSPGDDDELDLKMPIVFTWTPVKGAESYSLRIVEIRKSQSPDAAMKENRAFFEKKDIKTSSFQYSITAPKFEKGKKYGWMVSIGDLKSDIHMYRIMIAAPPAPDCICPFTVDALPPFEMLNFSTDAANPTQICFGNNGYNLFAASTAGAFTFEWTLNGPGGSSTTQGASYTFTPTAAGLYSLLINSYDGTTVCCHMELFFNAVSPIETYNTAANPSSVCTGNASLISLAPVINTNDFTFQWLISPSPCIAPNVLDPLALPVVTIDVSGINPPLNGWMVLTGFNGNEYQTPANLPSGLYCFSCAIRRNSCGVWSYSSPVQFEVFAPTVAGSLSIAPTQFCNDNQPHNFDITISGYTATQWTWFYSNTTTGNVWTPMPFQPVFTPAGLVVNENNITVTTNYKVTLQNGNCPAVDLIGSMTLRDPPPDGFICVEPDIKTGPAPGLNPCVIPYPDCPTTWLPVCYGCDAILNLTDVSGNAYPYTNTLTWDFLEEDYDYTYTSGVPDIPPQYSVNPPVTPPVNIINGAWAPTGFAGNTSINTNRLYKTTWYRAVAHDPTGSCPDKIFYCVVIVIKPPPMPVIDPVGPIITCQVPVNQSLGLQIPYTVDGFNLQYMWSPGGVWQQFPVQPYVATNYGIYTLTIKNECGEAVSNQFVIQPEVIPVSLQGECCVCEGECGRITATDIPGLTYSWSCDDPGLTLLPNNSTNYVEFCPTKPLTVFTLVVTNSNGCSVELKYQIKVCPKY